MIAQTPKSHSRTFPLPDSGRQLTEKSIRDTCYASSNQDPQFLESALLPPSETREAHTVLLQANGP